MQSPYLVISFSFEITKHKKNELLPATVSGIWSCFVSNRTPIAEEQVPSEEWIGKMDCTLEPVMTTGHSLDTTTSVEKTTTLAHAVITYHITVTRKT